MGSENSVSLARSEEEENPSVNQRESSPVSRDRDESKTLIEESVSIAKSKEEDPSENSQTEADEEEIEECGLCKFIKKGDCKEQWIAVEKCVDGAEEESDDAKCKEVRMMFKTCIFDNPAYYEPIISAQAQIVAKMLSELHAEKEALLAGEAAAIAKALSKLQTDKEEQPINILPAEAAAIAKAFGDLEDGKMDKEEKEAKGN